MIKVSRRSVQSVREEFSASSISMKRSDPGTVLLKRVIEGVNAEELMERDLLENSKGSSASISSRRTLKSLFLTLVELLRY